MLYEVITVAGEDGDGLGHVGRAAAAHGDQMAGAEQGDELVQILAGLQEGESVVVSANFLISYNFV